ncbi:MAG: DNA-3-methyladenine glycosylase [Nitrososphaera sp.]
MTDCLAHEFYYRRTAVVARALVGMRLVRTLVIGGLKSRLSGVIVETEAYGGRDDPASHARMGPTHRNSVMFGQVGRAYVYFTYGSHFCVNVSARSPGQPAGAVLIRALEPADGIAIMKSNRNLDDLYSLASGPGKLTGAMGITPALNGVDMTSSNSELYIELGAAPRRIVSTPRIGINRATEKHWRFVDPCSLHVSRKVRIKVR